MKKKNIKKLVKSVAIFICIVFICASITSTVMATNTTHLACCHDDNCPVCLLIQIAINFTKNINYIIEYIVLLTIVTCLLYIAVCRKSFNLYTSLVELKVRMDE